MNQHTIKADLLVIDALNAGEHLFRAVDLAYAQGATKAVDAFERSLEAICENFQCDYARKLFEKTAMQAIPIVLLSAARRKEISDAAMDAWSEYVEFLRAEHAEETADHYRELARDARLLGDAA